ncbi:uncharacterized protein LOC144883050 isoform X1 [Branchiostoma floridae x Branchiostoma japonicum]
MDRRCLLLLFVATSLLVAGASAIPYRKAYRNSAVDDNLLKALLRVQELEEEKAAEEAAEEEAEKEAVAETITELLEDEEARREEEALAEEAAAERAEKGRPNPPAYDFEYPEYEDPEEIPSNDINGELSYPEYEPIPAETRSLELPYNSYPRQQYEEEVDRRGDQYDLDKLYPDILDPDPEPNIPEPDDNLSPDEYAALLDYLGLQEDTRRSDGYYDGEDVNMLEDYDPRKTTKRARDHDAYHRAYNMFWSNLGKPREEEERRWDDSRDDTEEQDDWNEGGAYRLQELGAEKKALERPGDQGKVSWRHPGNDVATEYTGNEPYQREKYPYSLEDVMEPYEPEEQYWPYADEEQYQERSSQPEWPIADRDDQQDNDYESFLTRNERNDKILDELYENQIPANSVDEEEEEDDEEDKYEKLAETLLREYPELASAAERVLDDLIDEEEDSEDDERREDGMFGDAEEEPLPNYDQEEEQQQIDERADKNPLEGYTHNNIDILQRKRLFQDEEEEDEDEREGGGDEDGDEKRPMNYYDILKDDDERPNDEEENNDAEDPYSLNDVYDTNDEKKADEVDDYPDIPAEPAEDEPRSPEDDEALELDEDRVESFLDKVEDLLRATEAGTLSPPLCPVNVSDCHLIEDGSPLSSGPYKEYFTAVCNRHEACYQCGSAHGISSSTCDRAMKYDLAEVCDMLAEVEGQDVDDMCQMKGEALHLAARLKRAYKETTVPECSYKCVMEYIVGS